MKNSSKRKTGFASAEALFVNKANQLIWDNTEMRDRKVEARTRTIEDLQNLPHPQKLRTLTLCGEGLVHEQMLLDTSDISPHIEEMVCLEGNLAVFNNAQKILRSLPKPHQKKVTLIQAEDKHVFLFESGYQTQGAAKRSPRRKAHFTRGFDLIWLDWMNSFGKGIKQSIGLVTDNIGVFQRAWSKKNPGLLYFTLSCCKEEKADLESLHLALSAFEPDYKGQGYASDSFRIRYYGLGAFLNQSLQNKGAFAKPTHGMFYREKKTHAMTMFFAGFEIYPAKSLHRSLPEFPNPEFLGVHDPQETQRSR